MVTPAAKNQLSQETTTVTSTSSHFKRHCTSSESTMTSSTESCVTNVTSAFFSQAPFAFSLNSSHSWLDSPFPSSDPILPSSSKKQRMSYESSSTRSSSPPILTNFHSCSSSFTGHLDLVPPRSSKPQILSSGNFIPHASESPFSPLPQDFDPFSTFDGCRSLATSHSDKTNKSPKLITRRIQQAHNLSIPESEIRKIKDAFIKMAFTMDSQHPSALQFMRAALHFSLSFVEKNSLLRKLAHHLATSSVQQDKEEAIKIYFDLIEKEYETVLPSGKANWDTNMNFYVLPYFQLARLLSGKQTPDAIAEAMNIYDSIWQKEFTPQIKIKAALQKCELLKKRKGSCDLDVAIGIYSDAIKLLDKDTESGLAMCLRKAYASALLQRDRQSDRPTAIENLHTALDIRESSTASPSESSWADITKLLLKTLS